MNSKNALLLHAKGFLTAPTHYLKARKIFGKSASAERWNDTSNLLELWDERTIKIASMIPEGSSVLEFGAGREMLKAHLPMGCTYTPADIIAHHDQMIACDLNEAFPTLTDHYDYIVMSGVLEYIKDVDSLLAKLSQHCTHLLVSYSPTDTLSCIITRMRHDFVNHLSEERFVKMAQSNGFQLMNTPSPWNDQFIYHFVKQA